MFVVEMNINLCNLNYYYIISNEIQIWNFVIILKMNNFNNINLYEIEEIKENFSLKLS